MSPETAILWSLAAPIIGAPLIVLTGERPNLRECVTLATAIILFILVASIFDDVVAGDRPRATVLEILPGVSLAFVVEPLGMIFAGIASFLWIITSIYAIGYMRGHNEENQTRFYAFFAIAIASAIGIAYAGNMLTLFIFYEGLTLSTYPLVTHAGTDEARRGGRVYLGILISTSIGLQLVAIIWTWVVTGTLDFTEGGILHDRVSGPLAAVLLALYVFGIGKAAVMPFHRWLPAAMVAPTPVSALLHAVAVVKAGVFSVVKVIIYIFGVDYLATSVQSSWLVYVAGFTIIAASIVALRSNNLKRRLAYSTVSQLSYVVVAAALLAPLSLMGAAFHIAAHAFGKITLFFAAGAILVTSHKTEVSQLDGIGRRMPWTMTAFAIAALSMIGVPPTAGFVSKWYILQGALQAESLITVAVIVISTLLNAGYYLPIVYAAFFRNPNLGSTEQSFGKNHKLVHDHGEAPLTVVGTLILTALCTVLLFFFPDALLELGQQLSVRP